MNPPTAKGKTHPKHMKKYYANKIQPQVPQLTNTEYRRETQPPLGPHRGSEFKISTHVMHCGIQRYKSTHCVNIG